MKKLLAMLLAALMLLACCSAFAYAIISFFQAVGESKKSFILAILRKGILDIPMMFLLLRLIPVYGIVWATPIADVLCCITAVLLFTAFIRRLFNRAGYEVYL
jgi:Na+-driven multidrug efflux pump